MIKHTLFDLDNTLYSARYGLEEQVSSRISRFIAQYLGISFEEAWAERKRIREQYGTAIEWLVTEKEFAAIDDYYRMIHPEDEVDVLLPDPALGEFLESLPCAKAIMTNAPLEHARAVLARLEIGTCFTNIFDMRWLGFRGKPREDAFNKVLNALGTGPAEVLFIDDVPSYVEGYLAIGGRGILLDELNVHTAYSGERIQNLMEITRFL